MSKTEVRLLALLQNVGFGYFCYQKKGRLQSFQEVHNVAGVLTKKKCLSN